MTADKHQKRAARELAASVGISYTAALRRLTEQTEPRKEAEAAFVPHPGARPTVTCPACETGLLTLVEVESVPVVQWRYGCPHCGVEVVGARCGFDPHCVFHRLPPHAYTTTMPWQAGQGPTSRRNERTLTVEQLAEYGQPVDVLAELPLGPSPHAQITAAVAGWDLEED